MKTMTNTIDFSNPRKLHEIASFATYEGDIGDEYLVSFGYGNGYNETKSVFKLHHTAKYPLYATRKGINRFFAYEGQFGTGYVRFVPIPGQRGSLCTIEYWIRKKEGQINEK